ncbi:MAG: MBOAT family protein, partial [Lachnospiraceae bacterium]|nr:MBOAT family protein [Lachnospiraceae bacterium]
MTFLWIFLPVVLVINLLLGRIPGKKIQLQNIWLLLVSLFFYAWGEPFYVLLLMFSVVMNYCAGLLMERYAHKKGLILAGDVVLNLALLGYFKYCNFFLNTLDHLLPFINLPRTKIALPIGISFFTFQAMSYVIDLYRGRYRAQKNLFNLALYISFFPQLIAGPIVKYRDIDTQIMGREVTVEKFAFGVRRFIYGLGKKVIIANIMAQSVDKLFAIDASQMTTKAAWLGALFYTLQIYYDFSGYSDMAIGLGKMFGFDFLENFNYPYIADSIKDFWRRWHISLSSWFKEYLYIPLGGNRKGEARTYINLFIVFAVTGLWHGASWNFVGWGLYHGMFLIIERIGFSKVVEKLGPFRYAYAFLVAMIGWIFFRVESVGDGLNMVRCMFLPFTVAANGVAMLPPETVSSLTVLVCVLGLIGAGPLQKLSESVGTG